MVSKEWSLVLEALQTLDTLDELGVDAIDSATTFSGMHEADICREIARLCRKIRDSK